MDEIVPAPPEGAKPACPAGERRTTAAGSAAVVSRGSVAAGAGGSGALAVRGTGGGQGREELVHGEADALKQLAGVGGGDAGAALLVGDAVIIDGDEQLRLPLQPHDGELPQRHPHQRRGGGELDVGGKGGADAGGHLRQRGAAGAALAAADGKDDGIHRLHH